MKKDRKHIAIYIILGIIIVSEFGIIYFLNGQVYKIESDVASSGALINSRIDMLNSTINLQRIQTQSNINLINMEVNQTKMDLQGQIGSIQAKTSSDFSGIIGNSVKSVVSIKTNYGQGTGFIITNDGYVVTNAHVLENARYANAITSDQGTKSMNFIGEDTNMDIALLKIDGSYNYLQLDDSNNALVGEKVIAIGNPLGLSFSVSEGIISALNRYGDNGLPDYIQTDASLNPGNSGGPLIDTNGKVIGINNFKISGGENLGFALESNYIKQTVNNISEEYLNQSLINY